jgi:hypothetical protein
MQTIGLFASSPVSDAPFPRLPGIEDVLRCAPEEIHDLILALAAMVREVGLDAAIEALADEAVLDGVEVSPQRNSGPRGDVDSKVRHPLDPFTGTLRSSGQPRRSAIRIPPFNVIPAPTGGLAVCLPTVVALAHGTKAPRGLAMTLRRLREHLVLCGSGPKGLIGRYAILVTDAWSPQAAYESARDLAAHRDVAGLRIVAMHWDGLRWHSRGF